MANANNCGIPCVLICIGLGSRESFEIGSVEESSAMEKGPQDLRESFVHAHRTGFRYRAENRCRCDAGLFRAQNGISEVKVDFCVIQDPMRQALQGHPDLVTLH